MPGGASMITLKCGSGGSEEEAIIIAQRFLSKPLTQEYFELTMDMVSAYTWQQAFGQGFEIRGDMLGSATFLESTHVDARGCLTLTCGS